MRYTLSGCSNLAAIFGGTTWGLPTSGVTGVNSAKDVCSIEVMEAESNAKYNPVQKRSW